MQSAFYTLLVLMTSLPTTAVAVSASNCSAFDTFAACSPHLHCAWCGSTNNASIEKGSCYFRDSNETCCALDPVVSECFPVSVVFCAPGGMQCFGASLFPYLPACLTPMCCYPNPDYYPLYGCLLSSDRAACVTLTQYLAWPTQLTPTGGS